MNLDKIQSTIKTGQEPLTYNEKALNFSLLDFWQWGVSDLLSNATRGRFAEFIVATSTNSDMTQLRDEWSAYDLETPDGIKLEIKSAAYIQSWFQRTLSKILFSTKATLYWDGLTNKQSDTKKRHADVYVFCLLHPTNKLIVDPLNMQQVAAMVNATITTLYWQIGKHINEAVLKDKRAEYGKQIVANLSRQLTNEYGTGWGEKQLRQCMQFSLVFVDDQIVYALRRQLSWTHIRMLIYMNDPLKRAFYIEMCKLENWSSRQLRERINSMLYERTAISKKPELTIKNELDLLKNEKQISPDLVFRDPYFLDFLGLKDTYAEKDLENAILAELQRFIIEMGNDFAFMARQKRIIINQRDYKIDLLFYHRRLKCLIVIDLKLGEFESGYKGQMELYLRYLEKYEMVEGENNPIGLILCAGKNEEHIELLKLEDSNIRVAEYLTVLPPKKLLQEKLHQAIEYAQNKMAEINPSNVHE